MAELDVRSRDMDERHGREKGTDQLTVHVSGSVTAIISSHNVGFWTDTFLKNSLYTIFYPLRSD